jgi:hypothetical protein
LILCSVCGEISHLLASQVRPLARLGWRLKPLKTLRGISVLMN